MTEKEKEAEAPLLSSSGNSIDQHHCIITVQLYVSESCKSDWLQIGFQSV